METKTIKEILTILVKEKAIIYSKFYKQYVVESNSFKDKLFLENLCKKQPFLIDYLTKFSGGIKEMVYCLNNNLIEPPKCPYCNKPRKFKKSQYDKGPFVDYRRYSITCGNRDCKNKSVKATSMKLYGVNHPRKSQIVKEKTEQTNLKKYGVRYVTQNHNIMKKIEESNKKNHGGVWNNQLSEDKEKRQITDRKRHNGLLACQTEEVKKRKEQTNLKKYGVKCVTQNSSIQKKARKTCLKKYGVLFPAQNDIIKVKTKETIINKYGVSSYTQTPEYKIKAQKTCLEKYGFKSPLQTPKIKNKVKATTLKRYGVENISQSDEVKKTISRKALDKYGVDNISKSIIIKRKKRKTFEASGLWIPIELLEPFNAYYKIVHILTSKTYNKYKEEINPENLKRGRNGPYYQLDHKFSIAEGFLQNIPTEIISSKINLTMLSSKENRSKGKTCSISKEKLYKEFHKLEESSYFKESDLN